MRTLRMQLMVAYLDLAEVLETAVALQSILERDKFYSMLGLTQLPITELLLDPKYSLSVREVYTRAMRYVLQTTKPLSLLHIAVPGMIRKHDLPSWVSDSSNSAVVFWPFRHAPVFHTSTSALPHVHILPDSDTWIQVAVTLLTMSMTSIVSL
jgi:hypothetical protein